jgi:hypothetical protein
MRNLFVFGVLSCITMGYAFTPSPVSGQQTCQTSDSVPGFADEYLVDEYHERVLQQNRRATNPQQALLGVYIVMSEMVADGQAFMIPAGEKIVILNTKPLTGTGTSGTGRVKLRGRVRETGKIFWFHGNDMYFGQ